LNNLGTIKSDQGRRQVALARTEEAVRISRELAKTNPAYQESLARNAAHPAVQRLQLANPSAALPLLNETMSIAALLSPGSVLVEFQHYRSHTGSTEQFGRPRYLSLLLRPPDGTNRAIGLRKAAPIDAEVSRLDLAPLQRELAGSCPTPGYPWRARSRRRGSCTSPPWLLVGGSSPGERRRKGRGDRSHRPRRPRPAATQRPGIRRRQPARCQSRR
jgi:hypothetical protein